MALVGHRSHHRHLIINAIIDTIINIIKCLGTKDTESGMTHCIVKNLACTRYLFSFLFPWLQLSAFSSQRCVSFNNSLPCFLQYLYGRVTGSIHPRDFVHRPRAIFSRAGQSVWCASMSSFFMIRWQSLHSVPGSHPYHIQYRRVSHGMLYWSISTSHCCSGSLLSSCSRSLEQVSGEDCYFM